MSDIKLLKEELAGFEFFVLFMAEVNNSVGFFELFISFFSFCSSFFSVS